VILIEGGGLYPYHEVRRVLTETREENKKREKNVIETRRRKPIRNSSSISKKVRLDKIREKTFPAGTDFFSYPGGKKKNRHGEKERKNLLKLIKRRSKREKMQDGHQNTIIMS